MKVLHTFEIESQSYDRALVLAAEKAEEWVSGRENDRGHPMSIYDVELFHVGARMDLDRMKYKDEGVQFMFEIREE